ncbi:MAG: hypothetical protein ABNH02_01120 [Pseudomonadales bacterium]|jgi:hypothetical protein
MFVKMKLNFVIYMSTACFLILGCASSNDENTSQLDIVINDIKPSRSALKYFDASDGCPSYNDIPGAADYIGQSKVKNAESTMQLPLNRKIHVFYFKPRETATIMTRGGAAEIRRRAAQITLTGGFASLNLEIGEDNQIKWSGSGGVEVEQAIACEEAKEN